MKVIEFGCVLTSDVTSYEYGFGLDTIVWIYLRSIMFYYTSEYSCSTKIPDWIKSGIHSRHLHASCPSLLWSMAHPRTKYTTLRSSTTYNVSPAYLHSTEQPTTSSHPATTAVSSTVPIRCLRRIHIPSCSNPPNPYISKWGCSLVSAWSIPFFSNWLVLEHISGV